MDLRALGWRIFLGDGFQRNRSLRPIVHNFVESILDAFNVLANIEISVRILRGSCTWSCHFGKALEESISMSVLVNLHFLALDLCYFVCSCSVDGCLLWYAT
jgi:hypothetical protein